MQLCMWSDCNWQKLADFMLQIQVVFLQPQKYPYEISLGFALDIY